MIWCNGSALNIVRASKYEPEFQIKIIKPNIFCYFWICHPCSGCLRSLLSGKRENNWEKLPYCNGGVKTELAGFSLSSRVASRHSNFEYAASTSSVQASEIRRITPPFQKSAQLRIPPHQLNTRPCPHSNTKVFTTVENEPLGDITRSDVKDVAANNNTKQLFTEVVPRRKVARLTTRFFTFPPYILFKRRQGTRQFYPTRFIKWVPKPGPTQFYCAHVQTQTGTLYQMVSNGVIEKQSVEAVCENGRQVPSLKTLTPDLFIIIFFIIFCTLALWLS